MQIDKTTFSDISIFHPEEEYSLFHRLNFTKTVGGKEWLRRFFTEPHHDLKRITGTQSIIKIILSHIDDWPVEITNGTIIMIDKFLDYNLDPVPQNQNAFNSYAYKILHGQDYSMVRYSVKHFSDFYRGLRKLLVMVEGAELPANLSFYLDRIRIILKEEPLQKLSESLPEQEFTVQQNLYYAFHLRTEYKTDTMELVEIFSRLEAWYSMAMAVRTYNLQFPTFLEQDVPYFKAEGLFHVLIPSPVAYDLVLEPKQNFLFLTGANMAGKSTLIKAVGASVFLAHIGMGVPARSMELCVFDGLLSNINVADNIAKGESYFF